MSGYATTGSARRRNPYRVLRSKAGLTPDERREPDRRLMRISMAIRRFEARYHAPAPQRHWEMVDLPYEVPADVFAKQQAGASDYAQQRRDNLERLLVAIQGEASRAAKEKAERDELVRVMRANGMTPTGRKAWTWKKKK